MIGREALSLFCKFLLNKIYCRVNENLEKCLETFKRAGIVFLWKEYEPPEGLNLKKEPPETVQMLCRRLYAYRICKGYPSLTKKGIRIQDF